MIKVDTVTLVMIAGGVLLAALAIYYLFWKPDQKSDFQNMPQPSPPQHQTKPQPRPPPQSGPVLVLFYGNNCPHCHTLMPAWNEMKQSLAGKMNIKEIEGQNPEMSNYAQIKGVPTVRLYPKGVEEHDQFVEYSGDRSSQSLIKFATTGSS